MACAGNASCCSRALDLPGSQCPQFVWSPLSPAAQTHRSLMGSQLYSFPCREIQRKARTGKCWGLVGVGLLFPRGPGQGLVQHHKPGDPGVHAASAGPTWSWEAGPLSLRLHQGLGVSGALWVMGNEASLPVLLQRVSCPQILGSSFPEGPASWGLPGTHSWYEWLLESFLPKWKGTPAAVCSSFSLSL